MKYTRKKIRAEMMDEKMAIKDYHHLGLHRFEKDERKHLKYWKSQMKKR
jgi:hypothetical protein